MPRAARPTLTLPAALPADVRLMNAIADSVFVLAGAALLAAGVLWLMRAPAFAIRAIQLEGEISRNSLPTIRANAVPQLAGNFFSLDLQRGRAAFESVPWVRRAVVRRVWPDRLAVRLQEHRAAALWLGQAEEPDAERLVNNFGEIFEADVAELDAQGEGLPVLAFLPQAHQIFVVVARPAVTRRASPQAPGARIGPDIGVRVGIQL